MNELEQIKELKSEAFFKITVSETIEAGLEDMVDAYIHSLIFVNLAMDDGSAHLAQLYKEVIEIENALNSMCKDRFCPIIHTYLLDGWNRIKSMKAFI